MTETASPAAERPLCFVCNLRPGEPDVCAACSSSMPTVDAGNPFLDDYVDAITDSVDAVAAKPSKVTATLRLIDVGNGKRQPVLSYDDSNLSVILGANAGVDDGPKAA